MEPVPIDWSASTMTEVNSCALISSHFSQTNPPTLLQPASVSGTMPPALAVRVCEPTAYAFKALFGPFEQGKCGGAQAINVASVVVPGSTNLTSAEQMTAFSIGGCLEPLPLVSVSHEAKTSRIASAVQWSIERTMVPLSGKQPGQPEEVVVRSGPGAASAGSAVVTLSAQDGSTALFKETITLVKHEPQQLGDTWQVKGSINLVNPSDEPMRLSAVRVTVSPTGGGEPLTVAAECPKAAVKEGAKGKHVVLKPSGQGEAPLACTFAAKLRSNAPAKVEAAAVMAADGRRALSSEPVTVAFDGAREVAVGGCAKVFETHKLRNMLTDVQLGEGAVEWAGSRVPPKGSEPLEVCGTTTLSAVGQLGPLLGSGSASSPSEVCGSFLFTDTVTLLPVSGFQGRLTSKASVEVGVTGCERRSRLSGPQLPPAEQR